MTRKSGPLPSSSEQCSPAQMLKADQIVRVLYVICASKGGQVKADLFSLSTAPY